jgi:3-deoxy-D-manno-octulosonic acid kinase
MASATITQPRLQATDNGAILFDGSRAGADGAWDSDWFEPGFWQAQGAATRLGAGRGAAFRITAAGRDWVLRHYQRGGMVAPLLGDRYLWSGAERTRSFIEFRLLVELARRGLHVPAPVAARYRRSGTHYRADLITGYIDAAPTLAERLREGTLDGALATRVGAGVGQFHAAGACHADLNAHNVLIDARQVWLIDFDRGSLRVPARAWQLANLLRLRRSLLKLGAARDGEQRFDRDCWQPLAAAWERALGGDRAPAAAGSPGA